MFRDLTKEDIEVRVAQVKAKGISLLLYKTARCDMNILDETVGWENWQREHYECKGNLFCRVGINTNYNKPDKPERWIWKADCGAESYTEKEKGEASDSFKRSCFAFGIGRELYTAPFIWISSDKCTIKENKCYDKFVVEKIEIKDKKIVDLVIARDDYGKLTTVYRMSKKVEAKPKLATEKQIKIIMGIDMDFDKMFDYYKISKLDDLTMEQASEIIAKKGQKNG